MSNLDIESARQAMEATGEMDFIRQHAAAAKAEAAGETAPAPAPPADTVEVPVVEEGAEEVVAAQEAVAAEADALTPEEEEVLYLELDDATQALIDSKYDGDIGKALAALPDAQSVVGRQGNELGALRKQLEDMETRLSAGLQAAQPYPDWPDEFADPGDAAAQFREISEAAFARGDVQTFQQALGAWEEVDRVSVANYRDLKEMQIQAKMREEQAPVVNDEATLLEGVERIQQQYPQFQSEEFQAQVAAELDKTPSLKAVLWQGVPGVSPQERLAVLEEAAQRVIARTTSETVTQAKRRIAIRTSEEARAARAEAQVARGATARETGDEPVKRTMPMGESGRVLDIERMNAMLPPEDRI